MQRTSKTLASLLEYATQDRQIRHWLPALHILYTIDFSFLNATGLPDRLFRYIYQDGINYGIDFRAMLAELHFTGSQRQAVLVAWEFFNGGDGREGSPAEFFQICFRLDAANLRAVMDAMKVRTDRDSGGVVQQRLLNEMFDVLKSWEEAGL